MLGYDPYVDESLVSQYSIKLMSLPELLQEAARVLSGQWPRSVVNQSVKPDVNSTKENAR